MDELIEPKITKNSLSESPKFIYFLCHISFVYFCLMHLAQRVFDFYIFSNIHVAIATFCLAKITLLTFDHEENEVPLFILFATVVAYNFIRIYRITKIKSWFTQWLGVHKIAIYIIMFLSFILMVITVLQLKIIALISLIPFGLFTIFYVVPLKGITSTNTSLRMISGFKIFLIAFCWAAITVLFPLINYDVTFSSDVWIVFLQRFLLVLVITIPFDVRDLIHDEHVLKTIPQVLGLQRTKRLGLFLLMLFLGLTFFRSSITTDQFRSEFFVAVISLLFLIKSTPNQTKYYSSFFVESIPIIWLLLFLLI